MKSKQQPFKREHTFSSLVMLLLLVWLTVCLPYVNENQKPVKFQLEQQTEESPDNGETIPLTDTNEEKTEGSPSFFSEYLHEVHFTEHLFTEINSFRKCHPSDLYLAYHPDLIIPPPEA